MTSRTTGRSADSSRYEIRVGGHLDPRWAAWFDGMTLTDDDGDTVLTGTALDQAALHGVLHKVRDLGLPLLAVTRLDERNRTPPTHPASPRKDAP
ncbi:hypothetical protein ACI78V_19955 [Geodermatophilus sp. SYSU D00742]